MPTNTFYVPASDLKDLIEELNAAVRQHHVATGHVIFAPTVGLCSRAARKLLDIDSDRWMAEDDLAKAKLEIARLRVKLGHLPSVNDIVEIAYKDDLEVRQVVKGDQHLAKSVVWRSCEVGQLWNVGVNDAPGFSIIGSHFIHTADGFGTTWRFPTK